MAGSKRYFKYVSDLNESYTVVLDESNGETILNSGQIMPNRTGLHPNLPKGFRMRYLLAESIGTRKLQRKFYVGDPDLLIGLGDTIILEAKPYPDSEPAEWAVLCYRGEKRNFLKPLAATQGDTGLNDGDQGRDEV